MIISLRLGKSIQFRLYAYHLLIQNWYCDWQTCVVISNLKPLAGTDHNISEKTQTSTNNIYTPFLLFKCCGFQFLKDKNLVVYCFQYIPKPCGICIVSSAVDGHFAIFRRQIAVSSHCTVQLKPPNNFYVVFDNFYMHFNFFFLINVKDSQYFVLLTVFIRVLFLL